MLTLQNFITPEREICTEHMLQIRNSERKVDILFGPCSHIKRYPPAPKELVE